jgi:hypothetical protein
MQVLLIIIIALNLIIFITYAELADFLTVFFVLFTLTAFERRIKTIEI